LAAALDDAQAMVKRMFNDKDVNGPLTLSAVNSINWARLMAQVVYYFYAALRLGGPERKVAFSVPTGILAMCLPAMSRHKWVFPLSG
jgi:threonine synthase